MAFETMYEDPDIAVVDKPAHLVVHPGAGHDAGTLVHGLLARYPEIAAVGDPHRPGIVHRLDRGTSGLLLVARSPVAHRRLGEQLRSRRIERLYAALVWGHPEAPSATIDAPVGRSRRNPVKMTVTERGRPARTGYTTEGHFGEPAPVALLACRLETGRTHQIRVHLRAIGHPVVGDRVYGGRGPAPADGLDPGRPFLHARSLRLEHPVSGRPVAVESPLPEDLAAVLDRCR